MEKEKGKRKIIEIKIEGKNPDLWKEKFSFLQDGINNILDGVIDKRNNSTVRDEIHDFTNNGLDFGKQKLQKAGIENEKTKVEIETEYSKQQINRAEARFRNAEAEKIEIENSVKKLKLQLVQCQFELIHADDSTHLILLDKINAIKDSLNDIK